MKILLLGEYSRLHNSLKEGLIELGHEVFLIGYNDYFKDYEVDFKLDLPNNSGIRKILRKILYRLFKIDLQSKKIKNIFKNNSHLFEGYDVVQLINEHTFKTLYKTEIEILTHVFNKNKKVFLLSCGADFNSINYIYTKKLRYSILNPLNEKKVTKKKYAYILNYLSQEHRILHDFIFERISGVIASDLDYHLPLKNNPKYCGMVPNPINTEKINYIPLDISSKIRIFHGINEMNYFKKGHDFFEEALQIISKKYKDKVEIITSRNLPYKDYINFYDSAHIVLDQVYSYDQGYNALEAMAKGKVVFSGAEDEWLDYYKVDKDTILINALPNVKSIVEKLEWLIQNPENILQISDNARRFVEENHHYHMMAQLYIEKWQSY